jgi:hypothetical protein
MSGVINLRDILELVMNSLNDGSLPHHQLVKQRHESVLHVPPDPGNQLDSVIKQEFNGLITNDKFCLTRYGKLQLSWWRRPLRLRR